MSRRTTPTSSRRRQSAAIRQPPSRSGGILAFVAAVVLLLVVALTGTGGQGDQGAATPTPVLEPGTWWQLYFTEPVNSNNAALFVNGIDRYVVEAINAAQQTIDIAAFEFNLPSLTEALRRAAQERHVRVRIVTDDEHGLQDEDSTLGQLVSVGIPVVGDGRRALMHDKFILIDGRQVWTGSWNLTINDTFRNNNNLIAIRSPELAAIYTREFEEMFTGRQFGPTSPSFRDPAEQQVTINDTPIQVYFGPEDAVADKIAAQIGDARTNVRFMAFSFTHDTIGDAVLRQARAGLDVAGIFEKRGSTDEYSELVPLFCAQLPVRQDGNPRTFHHKVFILDNATVILGSFNFSASADRDNDENALIIRNAEIAARFQSEFDRRWAQGVVPEGVVCSN